MPKRLIKWLLKSFAVIVLLFVFGIAALLALLGHEHNTELTLPSPTGPFAVGRATFFWINNFAVDELAPTPGVKRAVMVWIWYPAVPTSGASSEYMPVRWSSALASHSGALMSKFLTRDPSRVRTNSVEDAPVSPGQPSYPVLLMRAGGGAFTTDFTTLAEDLASHGYIVAGFDAPYRTIIFVSPDGHVAKRAPTTDPENLSPTEANRLIERLLPMWTSDTQFVVNQLQWLNSADPSGKFKGRLDLQRLGMFGHSFGGATALQFCHDDPRCKAAVDIDGAPYGSVVRDGLRQPTLFLLSDHSREMSDPASREIGVNIHSIYDRLPNGRLFVTIRGANHFSFSDQILLKSNYVVRTLQFVGPFGHLDPQRGLTLTGAYLHTFFDVYLQGGSPSQLSSLLNQFPEAYPER